MIPEIIDDDKQFIFLVYDKGKCFWFESELYDNDDDDDLMEIFI